MSLFFFLRTELHLGHLDWNIKPKIGIGLDLGTKKTWGWDLGITGLRIMGFTAYTLSSSPTVELPVYKDENGV